MPLAGRRDHGVARMHGQDLAIARLDDTQAFGDAQGDPDDFSQVEHFAFPCVRIGAARGRHGGEGRIPVRPQRTDDHHRVRYVQERPDHCAGQSLLAVQVALQLIQPHHRLRLRRLRQRSDLSRPGRVHEPPVRQRRLHSLHRAAGLPTDDPPTSRTNPPRSAAAATLARTPCSAVSTSRGTYSGGTSSGTPGTLIAACTPSSRGSALLTCTAQPGAPVRSPGPVLWRRPAAPPRWRRGQPAVQAHLHPLSLQVGQVMVKLVGQRRQRTAARSAAHDFPHKVVGQLLRQYGARHSRNFVRPSDGSPVGIIQRGQLSRHPRLQHFQHRHRPGHWRILHWLAEGSPNY
jgi:hypothetical protein